MVPLLYWSLPKKGEQPVGADKCAAWQSYFVSSCMAHWFWNSSNKCYWRKLYFYCQRILFSFHSVHLSQSNWTWFQTTIWRSRRSFCPLDKATECIGFYPSRRCSWRIPLAKAMWSKSCASFIFWRYLGRISRRQPSTFVPYFIVERVPSNTDRRALNKQYSWRLAQKFSE